MRNRLRLALLVLSTLAIAAAAAQASAQGWPTRPVTVVVPFAAGSSTDTAARILAVGMSEALGQQLVIENVAEPLGEDQREDEILELRGLLRPADAARGVPNPGL